MAPPDSGSSAPGIAISSTRTADPDANADSSLGVDPIGRGLSAPWGVVPLDDGRALISERDSGRILLVDPRRADSPAGSGQIDAKTTVLTTLPDVQHRGEDGLLGLALTPDGDRLLAYYTHSGASAGTNVDADDNRIVSMSWNGSELGEPEVILSGLGSNSTHDGGRLVFGPDGYLYVGTGDAQTRSLPQDTKALNGKVLRITADGRPAPGNPFGNEVWSYGHRNVQGLAFDNQGRLWESEFGQDTWDEVNLISKGGNYGWPEVEGSDRYLGDPSPNYTAPVAVWPTDSASPSGLSFWRGSLWLAALRGSRLWEIPLSADGAAGQPVAHLAGEYGRLRTVVPASDGSLWLTTSNTDGRGQVRSGDDQLLRITPS